MAKIVLWGFSSTGTDIQQQHLHGLQSANFNFQFGKHKSTDVLKDCLVFINHDGGISAEQLPAVQWKIDCGGSIKQPKLNSAKNSGGIPFQTLTDNLASFLNAVSEINVVMEEHIKLLFNADPSLEDLLRPFTAANPLDASDVLMQARAKLLGHLKITNLAAV